LVRLVLGWVEVARLVVARMMLVMLFRLQAEERAEPGSDRAAELPLAAQRRRRRRVVFAAGHLHVVHLGLEAADEIFLDLAALSLGRDPHGVPFGGPENPPGLAPFLVTEKAAAKVGCLADIERLQEETEAAADEDINAARVGGNAVLRQRAAEMV